MAVERHTDPAAFYRQAAPFLLAREADHNLMLGLCAELQQDLQRYGPIPPYFATVTDQGTLVAAALMTPPHRLILSHILAPAAIEWLADDLIATFGRLPGVLGPQPYTLAFAQHWQRRTGQTPRLEMAERIYQLRQVQPVGPVPGQLRAASTADRALLSAWFGDFHREAMRQSEIDEAGVSAQIGRWIAAPDHGLYVWEHDGPAAMTGVTGPTPHGIRISAVYTPPERRKRGYASALVAAVSQRQLDSGRQFCFLFTDLGNPTSNRIYQAIGYQPVCDVDAYNFE